jgi:hypothetical protein
LLCAAGACVTLRCAPEFDLPLAVPPYAADALASPAGTRASAASMFSGYRVLSEGG